ncbi:methionine ABC transporter permease [Bifidobacterium crudilactis]|jgi:D-methionine transport system permease protein|uniref:ABC transporter permease n=1 Tax=Bifidobacterium crudilactis TaxID=327277 RepID=A0A971CYQ5_9BIFI|nr:methionine ABC transporter permease [Bifidobacterium crudilactis]MCI1217416.1 ABC transporter permease [Bifidobacterium crudilactis]MCI1636527.1 ABC transporter permease [Bifidobacterium crudilactis]MCI1643245.1 ABC transporter permease [Bifidobacterium crudilactis]MCI1664571.1 ABC transporter permease [Bifidobacterium crudilactis]MCI1869231.1 ABC transporter permease [Bifidobacterium crudilactis]
MPDILQLWFPNVVARFPEFFDSFVQTLIMVGISGLASFVLATFLAVVLTVTKTGGLAPNPIVFNIIDKIINLFRSIPFIILAAALVSVTRALVGTAIGTKGAIFPLIVGITPFFTRQIESSLAGLDPGFIEAAEAMGMGNGEIIFRIYLREAIPSIIRVTIITLVSLIGLTAIVGIVGGGGLGDFAIRYGYQRFMPDATYATIIVLVLLIGLIEFIGRLLVEITEH